MPMTKEKRREYDKKYNKENKEKIAERCKKYREKNKEQLREKAKKYREENKEILAERSKKYIKSKKGREKRWKNAGMKIFDDTYEKYENATHCELCNVEFEGSGRKRKCLDHCHNSGYIRFICCDYCNNIRITAREKIVHRLHQEFFRWWFRNK